MGKRFEYTFFPVKMYKRPINTRCSTLVIRKMQTKTTMRYHFIPSRMAKIKMTDNNVAVIILLGIYIKEIKIYVHTKPCT